MATVAAVSAGNAIGVVRVVSERAAVERVSDGATVGIVSGGRITLSARVIASDSASALSGETISSFSVSDGCTIDAAGELTGLVSMLASLTVAHRTKVDSTISMYMKCNNCLMRK